MQKQKSVTKNHSDRAAEQIVLYKAISIVSARLAEKLAALEKDPIHMKGGYGYDTGQSTIIGK